MWVDGLKGIFSILVVFCHLSCVFSPGLYFLSKAETNFEKIWLNTPLNIITNGNTAVQFFFVASGLLIARSTYYKVVSNKDAKPLEKKVLALFKITTPAITFSWVLMCFHLMFQQEALMLNPNLSFLESYNSFEPSVIKCLFEIFLGVFVKGSDFVGPLWTIRIELLGTLITSSITYYVYKNKHKGLYTYAFMSVVLLFVNENLCAFMFGAMVWDTIVNKKRKPDIISKIVRCIENFKVIKYFFTFFGLYLACCNMHLTGVYAPFLYVFPVGSVIRSAGISLCVLIIFLSPMIQSFFSKKQLVSLGKISAYVYAFHWPIILSLGCGMFVSLSNRVNYTICVILISISCLTVSILLAFCYKMLQDRVLSYLKSPVC